MSATPQPEPQPAAERAARESWATRAHRFFFGDDVFVSYARHDSDYALALADELTKQKLSCFVDQWGTPAGRELPSELVQRLGKSTLLVVVGTQWAAASDNVRKEVVEFKKTGRPIIPITFVEAEDFAKIRNNEIPKDLTGTLERAAWYGEIAGIARTVESKARLKADELSETADPSEHVITRIVNARGFLSRSKRLRKTFWATLGSLLALLGAGGCVAWLLIAEANARVENARSEQREALKARDAANGERDAANGERDAAAEARDIAKAERDDAQRQTRQAAADLLTARGELKKASADLLDANRKTLEEQAKAELARRDAARQQEVALTRRLANQSALALRQRPDLLISSVALAVEAQKRSHDLDLRSLEADTALRDSVGLLPVSLGSRALEGGIAAVAFSPGGESFAAETRVQTPGGSETMLAIRRSADGGEIARLAAPRGAFAISRDGGRAAVSTTAGDANVVRVSEVGGGLHWDVPIENSDDSVDDMALSPDGKYLLLALKNADAEMGENFAELWDVENTKRVKRLDTGGFIDINATAFSPNGEHFAVAGAGIGARGREVGRTLIWNISFATDKQKLTARDVRGPEEFLQDWEVRAVAVSDDGKDLATTAGRTVLVWRRSNRGSFQQVGRMPLEQDINELAFDHGRKTLVTFSGARREKAAVPKPRSLETWGLGGYREAFSASHDADILGIAFGPGDEFVTTVNDGYSGKKLRAWSVRDGSEINDARVLPDTGESAKATTEDAGHVVTNANGVWRVWDVRARKSLTLPADPEGQDLGEPTLSPGGKVMARVRSKRGVEGGSVAIYRLEGDAYVREGEWPIDLNVPTLTISPAGDRLVAGGYQKPLQLRRVGDGKDVTPAEIKALKRVESVRFSPSGGLLAVLAWNGTNEQRLLVWDFARARVRTTVPTAQDSEIGSYSFSPRGRYLAAADSAGAVRILDLKNEKAVTAQHDSAVTATAFSADERYLAIGDGNGSVKIFDAATAEQVVFLPHYGIVEKIVFSQDGTRLAAGTRAPNPDYADDGEESVLHVWLLSPPDLIKEACRRMERFGAGGTYSPFCSSQVSGAAGLRSSRPSALVETLGSRTTDR